MVTNDSHAEERQTIRVLMIEAIGKCNAICPYCPRGANLLPRDSHHAISMETLDRALRFARRGDNRGVYLHHRGEPFLHPELGQIIRKIRAAGFFAFLSTNLLSVNEKRVRCALESGLNELQMHLTAGMTRLGIDTLLERVHMIRWLNWTVRNNSCKVEINYALVNESKQEAINRLSASPYYDETFGIYFYVPHPWPQLSEMIDRGVDPTSCNWYKERSAAILSNGDVVICCLDQWGKSKTVNIWDIDELKWEHLCKRDICKGCLQHVEMDWLRRDAIDMPDWLERRQRFDPWKL